MASARQNSVFLSRKIIENPFDSIVPIAILETITPGGISVPPGYFLFDERSQAFERAEEYRPLAMFIFNVFPTESPLREYKNCLFPMLTEHIEDWSIITITTHKDEALVLVKVQENFLCNFNIKVALAPQNGF
jgi:hypothetical protein